MESKSQAIFPLMEQVRVKISEIVSGGRTQADLADELEISRAAMSRFVNGRKIDCVAFSKLLIYFGMVQQEDGSKNTVQTICIEHNALKKHSFIKKSIDEINNSAKIPSISLMKILKNLLDSEIIREESLLQNSPKK